jgi:hypothetical protein
MHVEKTYGGKTENLTAVAADLDLSMALDPGAVIAVVFMPNRSIEVELIATIDAQDVVVRRIPVDVSSPDMYTAWVGKRHAAPAKIRGSAAGTVEYVVEKVEVKT